MCQLLGMNANTPTDVMFSFTGLATRADEHKDGFGIAFFEDKGLRLFVDPHSARASPVADMVRRYPIKSGNVIAHIRKATQGRVALENTHPFQRELWGRYWVFAHNGDLKGAPLRCSLDGALYTRPGMLATGESIGSTYDFSGEGIGKAMQTGMLAAASIGNGRERQWADAAVCADYEAGLRALQPRFELYRKASRVNAHPWLADLVIWRARKSQRILRRMSGVLEETANPGNLVSARGIAKLFLPIR